MVLYPMSPLNENHFEVLSHKLHPSCNLLNKKKVDDIYPRKTFDSVKKTIVLLTFKNWFRELSSLSKNVYFLNRNYLE